ncbi:MAG: DUF1667 domain-containing protein [Chitinivibrionales bacterium]|nr:DUF1667 domain-containing protein [Chitinivibrionales bacterium]MBD3394918.1 DUF1667 domain-containing protein [Chitinivibrionales bacterium]
MCLYSARWKPEHKDRPPMNIVCIVCPNGCRLTVRKAARGTVVTGNQCARGAGYGIQEATDPKRVVTAVARTSSSDWPCVPVKTSGPVSRDRIKRVLKAVYGLRIDLPVTRGDMCIKNVEKTGVSVVFTRTLPPVERKREE